MKLDTFTTAYIEAALWSSTDYAHGECPCCGKKAILSHYPEMEYEWEAMCSECGAQEIANPEPLDSNYNADDIAPETLKKMIADCTAFQKDNDLEGYGDSQAGHDFWLTREGHGAGFWEEDHGTPEQCAKLEAAAKAFGEFNLYVGDDGRIHH